MCATVETVQKRDEGLVKRGFDECRDSTEAILPEGIYLFDDWGTFPDCVDVMALMVTKRMEVDGWRQA